VTDTQPDAERTRLRVTFEEAPEAYRRARPGYPEELFDDLLGLTGLRPGDRVLEVGCGTGQATEPLARRGLEVTCIELGEGLARVAAQALSAHRSVRVVAAEFESWRNDGPPFDLVLAAMAWHWIDPARRDARAAAALRPGGRLAVVSGQHVLPEGGDAFFTEIQDAYAAIGEGGPGPGPPEAVPDRSGELEASGLFRVCAVRRYVMAHEYDADAYVDLLDTFSGHRSMAPDARARLYAEIRRRIAARPGGRVRKHELRILHVARLRGAPPVADRLA
jgi:SAM-dependent methyltransferase